MAIIVNLDIMMARRKISLGELAEKIDIFYAAGKLTDEHYSELTGMLAEKKEQV